MMCELCSRPVEYKVKNPTQGWLYLCGECTTTEHLLHGLLEFMPVAGNTTPRKCSDCGADIMAHYSIEGWPVIVCRVCLERDQGIPQDDPIIIRMSEPEDGEPPDVVLS